MSKFMTDKRHMECLNVGMPKRRSHRMSEYVANQMPEYLSDRVSLDGDHSKTAFCLIGFSFFFLGLVSELI